jgi:hypothetical protein
MPEVDFEVACGSIIMLGDSDTSCDFGNVVFPDVELT